MSNSNMSHLKVTFMNVNDVAWTLKTTLSDFLLAW